MYKKSNGAAGHEYEYERKRWTCLRGGRYIRMVKERARATVNTLPFEILPHQLIVKIVYNAVFWLNFFPHKDGIHPTISPHNIVTESKVHYNKHCKLQFGAYVQVHEQNNTPRAIVLCPTSNAQGSYYFLSLHSRKLIVQNNWTILPKWQNHAVCKTKEGPIRDTTGSTTVMEAIIRCPEWMGLQTKWIWSMIIKQSLQQTTMKVDDDVNKKAND